MTHSRRPDDPDKGSVLVIAAVFILVLVAIAALVVDLASVRSDQRTIQTAADFAALSGANNLDYASGGSSQLACTEAWAYLQQNLPDLPTGEAFSCSGFTTQRWDGSSTSPCPTSTDEAPQSIGSYTITMETPVPDGDPMMSNFEGIQPSDGNPCQRFGVQIRQHQPFVFGPAAGTSSGNVAVHAVALYSTKIGPKVPDLAALDKHICDAVSSGSGDIWAYPAVDSNGKPVSQAEIYADSDGTANCNGGHYVLDTSSQNSGGYSYSGANCSNPPTQAVGGSIWAGCDGSTEPGVIATYALTTQPASAYENGYNYFPVPVPLSAPITRAPVDARYHCSNLNPVPLNCNDYINDLKNLYGYTTTSGSPGLRPTTLPTGWTRFTLVHPSCTIKTTVTIQDNTYVDCPSGLTIQKPGSLTIDSSKSGGAVVFEGSISFQGSGGSLTVVPGSSPQDTVLYLQNSGSLTVSSNATVDLPQTLVYSGQGTGGCLNFLSGSSVTWSAITGNTPSLAPYTHLIFWSEGSCAGDSTFDGGAILNMHGILFSPNAIFRLTGGSPINAFEVQFWVDAIQSSSSGAGILLRPDPTDAITLGAGVSLIR